LVGYVVPPGAEWSAGRDEQEEDEQVQFWRELYDSLYAEQVADGGFWDDFAVWQSSYDGRHIPTQDMERWRSAAVDQVLRLAPPAGCWRSASVTACCCPGSPRTATRTGGNRLLPVGHRRAAGAAAARGEDMPGVRLRVQAADDTDGLPRDFFDTIVLNSVVQYFPPRRLSRGRPARMPGAADARRRDRPGRHPQPAPAALPAERRRRPSTH
ncbi:hypothetical protein GTV15_00315, partial [Streptomyces sp. SID7803]|nr:hypothetical protein [Streptomyces sp. SID7803]